ncbi:MAG: hypothetical protein EA402_02695 [Planctomycetota bacterium]|nr:MAG: hypothetical protein EA402_02695 [Planctomycetota bacterium]
MEQALPPVDQGALAARYARPLPALWASLQQLGCFDPHHQRHLQLSDLRWLDVPQIVAWRFPADSVDDLLPFAVTGLEDLWCLTHRFGHGSADLDPGGPPRAVVFCPHEDEVAFAYAPNFSAFIFRAVLEEYACTCLTEYHSPGRSLAILGDYAATVAPLLPSSLADILRDVGERPLQELEHGYFGTLNADEAQAVIAQVFADWPDFDREFEHVLGN